jgi:hypothetical protein
MILISETQIEEREDFVKPKVRVELKPSLGNLLVIAIEGPLWECEAGVKPLFNIAATVPQDISDQLSLGKLRVLQKVNDLDLVNLPLEHLLVMLLLRVLPHRLAPLCLLELLPVLNPAEVHPSQGLLDTVFLLVPCREHVLSFETSQLAGETLIKCVLPLSVPLHS